MLSGILMTFMFLIAVFLILLVLVQRGRGGGLAGALGGMGGQSAFGTKAGDLFTRITIGAATVWILLCAFGVNYYNRGETFEGLGKAANKAEQDGGGKRPGPATGSDQAPGASDKSPLREGPALPTDPDPAPAASSPATKTDSSP